MKRMLVLTAFAVMLAASAQAIGDSPTRAGSPESSAACPVNGCEPCPLPCPQPCEAMGEAEDGAAS